MSRFGTLGTQFFDGSGDPLAGGQINFYKSGTTTRKTTYADISQTIPNTNPVVLTGDGRLPHDVYFDGVCDASITTSAGAVIEFKSAVGSESTAAFADWTETAFYSANDIVSYNGDYYVSLTSGNQGNEPTASGWENYWMQIKPPVVWNTNASYAAKDIVQGSDGLLYYATIANTGNNPVIDNGTNWTRIENKLYWSATKTYNANDVVLGSDDRFYSSKVASNLNTNPATDYANVKWKPLSFKPADFVTTNWTLRDTITNLYFYDICWSETLGLFCAVGRNVVTPGTEVATSPDGINWTTRTSGASGQTWQSVVWADGLSLFVAVGSVGGLSQVMTSPDGITWTGRTAAAVKNWVKVAWSESLTKLVAVANSGETMYSSDGTAWTSSVTFGSNHGGLAWSPDLGIFCEIDATGTSYTSVDGINWTNNGSTTADATEIAWSPELGIFCAVDDSAKEIYTSANGTTWTTQTAPSITYKDVEWCSELGIFCASASSTGNATTNIATSTDGVNWISRVGPKIGSTQKIAWSPKLGCFGAASLNYELATSAFYQKS